MLFYAQPLSRLLRLTTSDITYDNNGQVLLHLGHPPPPPPRPPAPPPPPPHPPPSPATRASSPASRTTCNDSRQTRRSRGPPSCPRGPVNRAVVRRADPAQAPPLRPPQRHRAEGNGTGAAVDRGRPCYAGRPRCGRSPARPQVTADHVPVGLHDDAALTGAAQLLRRFHDATAGFGGMDRTGWQF